MAPSPHGRFTDVNPSYSGRFLAEFVGSLILGLSNVLITEKGHTPIVAGVPGFLLASVTYSGGPISGAHFNPALTIAVYLRGIISLWIASMYIVSQLLGFIVGAALGSWFLTSPHTVVDLSPLFSVPTTSTVTRAFVGEMMFTFAIFIVYMHMMTVRKQARNSYFGFAIGCVAVAGDTAMRLVSGAVFNPALALSAAFISAVRDYHCPASTIWVYCVAPVVAGVMSVVALTLMHPTEVMDRKHPLVQMWLMHQLWQPATEFVGTLCLTMMACTSGFGTGFGLAGLIHMGYYLTGAQYNPVVTLVVFIRGGISLKTAVTYVVMQGIAGLCGGAIGSTILGGKLALVLADDAKAWVMELFWTFFLVYIILTVCSPELKEFCQYYAMGIGFLVVMGAFAAGPFSAAVFNPAVGIAVCFAAKSAKIWIYFTACPVGGLIGHFTEKYISWVTKRHLEAHPSEIRPELIRQDSVLSMFAPQDSVMPLLRDSSRGKSLRYLGRPLRPDVADDSLRGYLDEPTPEAANEDVSESEEEDTAAILQHPLIKHDLDTVT